MTFLLSRMVLSRSSISSPACTYLRNRAATASTAFFHVSAAVSKEGPRTHPKKKKFSATSKKSTPRMFRTVPMCPFVFLTVLSDTSTTRLARAEDVKKPPKATGKRKHSSPSPTHQASNLMDNQRLPRGVTGVLPTTVRRGPRILQIRKQRNVPKGWIFFATKHWARSSNRAKPS